MSGTTRYARLVAKLDALGAALPDGVYLGYTVIDDVLTPPDVQVAADAEIKRRWRDRLGQRLNAGDAGADVDVAEVPADSAPDGSGRHVLIELLHVASGAQRVAWLTPAQVDSMTVAQARTALRALADEAVVRAARQPQRRG